MRAFVKLAVLCAIYASERNHPKSTPVESNTMARHIHWLLKITLGQCLLLNFNLNLQTVRHTLGERVDRVARQWAGDVKISPQKWWPCRNTKS